ncbi:MAG: PfkB family carbohydrate kinase [Bdellovibrionales bacterium]|jgi:sugar/nucleoside kinase (ribokinase family)
MIQNQSLFDVVGIGRSYVDVIASAPYALLNDHDIPLDTGRFFDAQQIKEIQAKLKSPQHFSGGAIPNTIAGVAALGARAGYFGNVADDDLGRTFSDDLAERKIDDLASNPLTGNLLSGTCIVLLTEGGERSFALHKGCVDHFNPADFSAFDFSSTRYLLVGGNLLSNAETADIIANALEQAATTSCKIVITVSEVRNWQGRETYANDIVARHADILVGNETEMQALFAITGEITDPEKIILTTKGAQGSCARHAGKTLSHRAMPHACFVNSLGAGDQFLAGFLKAQTLGWPVDKSLRLATRCADAIIAENEARPRADVSWESFLPSII